MAGAGGEAAPMQPDHHRPLRRPGQTGSPDVQTEAVFRGSRVIGATVEEERVLVSMRQVVAATAHADPGGADGAVSEGAANAAPGSWFGRRLEAGGAAGGS